jgi:hypothetical protein
MLQEKTMAIPFAFDDLVRRLSDARSWAFEVAEGNRCAMVLGLTLKLKPSGNQATMRGQSFVSESVRNQPFTDGFFVKAWDLAETVLKSWGPPSKRVDGTQALKQLEGQKGFVFLEDCWRTPREKVNKLLFGVDVQSGDHVDLWDGSALAIYPARMDSVALLSQSRKVWFWECRS